MDLDAVNMDLKHNSLYLLKIKIFKATTSSFKKAGITVKQYFKTAEEKTLVKRVNIEIPIAAKTLTPKSKADWFEKHILIPTNILINHVEISFMEPYPSLEFNIRCDQVLLSNLNKDKELLMGLNEKKVKRNGKVYSIFYGINDAIAFIDQVSNATNVDFPRLGKIKKTSERTQHQIGLVGDGFFAEIINSTYDCTHINTLNTIHLMRNNFFDLIIVQKNARQLFKNNTLGEENLLLTQLGFALQSTKTPVYEISPSQNEEFKSLLSPKLNCFVKEPRLVNQFELCQFLPLKEKPDQGISVFVPSACDLYQDQAFFNLISKLSKNNISITVAEAQFGYSPQRTLKLINNFKVKFYEKLTVSEIAKICRSCSFMVLPSQSLRTQEELNSLAIIAILNGCIPIVFRNPLSTKIGALIKTIQDLPELLDYLYRHYEPITHEKVWLNLFRKIRRLQMEGVFKTTLDTEIQKQVLDVAMPQVEMISVSKRPHNLENILQSYSKQSYKNLKLHIIWNIKKEEVETCHLLAKKHASENIKFSVVDQTYNIGTCLNYGMQNSIAKFWFKIDDDDCYGKYYIEDAVNYYLLSDAAILGKPHGLMYFKKGNRTMVRKHFSKNSRVFLGGEMYLCGATLSAQNNPEMIKFSDTDRNSCDSNWIKAIRNTKLKGFSADGFNFSVYRGEQEEHTWKVNPKTIEVKYIFDFRIHEEWSNAE